MSATHDDIINVDVALQAAPLSQAGFGRVLFLATDLTFSGGEDYKIYTSATEVDNDNDLTSAQKNAAKTALSQSPQPEDIMVAPHDKTGGDDYATSLNNVLSANGEFYGVTIESRTDADIIEASDDVEALGDKLFFAQSDDAQIIGGTIFTGTSPNGAFSAIAGNERTVLYYHDEDTEFLDVAHAASRLVFDPDEQSAGWQGSVSGVAPYTAAISSGEESQAESNNVNLMLPFGNDLTYVSSGVTIQDRNIAELVSADWYKARLTELLITLKQKYDSLGQKIPLSPVGQNIVRGEIEKQNAIAVDAGHFLGGEDAPTVSFPDPIPDADITAGVLKASVSALFATNAKEFDLSVNLSRT